MSYRPLLPPLAAVAPHARSATLSPAPGEIRIDTLEASDRLLTVVASAIRPAAACPVCNEESRRVYSRYERTLADLPWQGVAVRMRLRTRRFFCETVEGVMDLGRTV